MNLELFPFGFLFSFQNSFSFQQIEIEDVLGGTCEDDLGVIHKKHKICIILEQKEDNRSVLLIRSKPETKK